jgi:hypothetical protein
MAGLLKGHWKLALLCTLSLIAVATISLSAQLQLQLMTEMPQIVSGNDIGFRIDSTKDGFPVGTLMIRMNGRWVQASSSMSVGPSR